METFVKIWSKWSWYLNKHEN